MLLLGAAAIITLSRCPVRASEQAEDRGNSTRAEGFNRSVLRLDPSQRDPHYDLVRMLSKPGKYPANLSESEKALDSVDEANCTSFAVAFLPMLGRTQQAREGVALRTRIALVEAPATGKHAWRRLVFAINLLRGSTMIGMGLVAGILALCCGLACTSHSPEAANAQQESSSAQPDANVSRTASAGARGKTCSAANAETRYRVARPSQWLSLSLIWMKARA